jgi:tight adherence protein B
MTAFIELLFGDNETFFFVILSGVAAAIAIGSVFWISAVANEKRRIERRLSNVTNRATGGLVSGDAIANVRKSTSDSSVVLLDQAIKRILPNREQLRAGISWFLFGASPFLLLCAILLAGVGLPYLLTGFLGARRRKKFVAQFPEAIDMIVRGIKSGLPVTEAMSVVGSEMLKPIGVEFSLAADNIRFGKTLDESLWEMAERIKSPEYDFFVVALSVQRETGGNLAETL